MTAAVDAMGMTPDDRAELIDYLAIAARSLQNAH
jgi:truncated hemoglobin YjbI